MTDESVRTPVWRLVGATRSVPGVLAFHAGRVSFTTVNGVAFDHPRGGLQDVKFPWYWFGGGVTLVADGEKYRFSFLKPNAGQDVPPTLLGDGAPKRTRKERAADVVGVLTMDLELGEFSSGRKAGKAWKRVLGHA